MTDVKMTINIGGKTYGSYKEMGEDFEYLLRVGAIRGKVIEGGYEYRYDKTTDKIIKTKIK